MQKSLRLLFGQLACGVSLAVATSLSAQSVIYQEANGVVVVEAETLDVVSPWTVSSSVSGHLGTGYLRGGLDSFNNPGTGIMEFYFTVQNSGRYQINWRSRIGSGSSNTDFNDSWARMTDSNGSPLSPVSNNNVETGSSEWYKLYMNRLAWDYETSNRDNDPKSLSWNLVAGQTYRFQISARSEDHLIDRFVLWSQDLHTYANEDTGKTFGSTSSNLDALAVSSTGGVVEPPDPEDLIPVLFIRGGSGTTGFLSGADDELASDITDDSTSSGNHGWGALATLLEANGFAASQLIEGSAAAPAPIDFNTLDLSEFQIIVLGSNNADYAPGGDTARIDAIEDFVRGGGGLLCISDAHFGSSWSAASDSDQQFLNRFGIVINQDIDTYTSARASGDYLIADHPILTGIDEFSGQGVTAFSLGDEVPGVTRQIIVRAELDVRRNDSPSGGTIEAATANDGALVVALAGGGRVAGHYDPNTFFNANGAGTNLTKHDNADYALNLFTWLAGGTAPEEEADSKAIFTLTHFNEIDRELLAVSGDAANVDGDAFTNGAEYILGLNPWQADFIEPVTLQPATGATLTLQFTVRKDLATGYGVELFETDDLLVDPWAEIALGTLSQQEMTTGFWDYSLSVNPATVGEQTFWRLNFVYP